MARDFFVAMLNLFQSHAKSAPGIIIGEGPPPHAGGRLIRGLWPVWKGISINCFTSFRSSGLAFGAA
jgi:hypothetical protein